MPGRLVILDRGSPRPRFGNDSATAAPASAFAQQTASRYILPSIGFRAASMCDLDTLGTVAVLERPYGRLRAVRHLDLPQYGLHVHLYRGL